MKSMIFLLCILAAGIGGAFYLKSKTVEVTQVMEQINTGKIDPNTLDMAKKLLENPELKNHLKQIIMLSFLFLEDHTTLMFQDFVFLLLFFVLVIPIFLIYFFILLSFFYCKCAHICIKR